MEIKHGFNQFSLSVGRLRGLNLVIHSTDKITSEFTKKLQERVQKLLEKLEAVDL
jgi:hypothetical protein